MTSYRDHHNAHDDLRSAIRLFGEASDGELATSLSKECREFEGDDPVRFMRDLRDKCVRYSGSTAFVIKAITAFLSAEPEESEADKAERRAAIEQGERGP